MKSVRACGLPAPTYHGQPSRAPVGHPLFADTREDRGHRRAIAERSAIWRWRSTPAQPLAPRLLRPSTAITFRCIAAQKGDCCSLSRPGLHRALSLARPRTADRAKPSPTRTAARRSSNKSASAAWRSRSPTFSPLPARWRHRSATGPAGSSPRSASSDRKRSPATTSAREELQDHLLHMAHSISIDLGWRPDRGRRRRDLFVPLLIGALQVAGRFPPAIDGRIDEALARFAPWPWSGRRISRRGRPPDAVACIGARRVGRRDEVPADRPVFRALSRPS